MLEQMESEEMPFSFSLINGSLRVKVAGMKKLETPIARQ